MNRPVGIIILLILMSIHLTVFAQKIFTVSGRSRIMLNDNISMNQAKEEAKQQALINAIEDQFGTYVDQDASAYIHNGHTDFRIIGNTRVKGEWLKTLDENYDVLKRKDREQGISKTETWITCRVTGLAREVNKPATSLRFLPLDCPDLNCVTYDFKNGEPFYLYFKSPVDGKLNIYISENDSVVYRLLPYKNMNSSFAGEVPVTADKDYIFFAEGEKFNYFNSATYQSVDEMTMVADHNPDVMELYIVFSSGDFEKPRLNHETPANNTIPYFLGMKEFKDWLEENLIYNKDFTYRTVSLTVSK